MAGKMKALSGRMILLDVSHHCTWRLHLGIHKTRLMSAVRKRAKAGQVAWTPKDKDARVIPLPKHAVDLLSELLASAPAGQVYVFVKGKGPTQGSRMARANIWRDFRAIRRRASVCQFGFHDLRKSYCTHLSTRLPMHLVQELAGHSDIRTTRRFYVKVKPEMLDDARSAVEATLKVQELEPD